MVMVLIYSVQGQGPYLPVRPTNSGSFWSAADPLIRSIHMSACKKKKYLSYRFIFYRNSIKTGFALDNNTKGTNINNQRRKDYTDVHAGQFNGKFENGTLLMAVIVR